MSKPRLLLIGDAAVPTGFARANRNLIEHLRADWAIAILGVNAKGDPHDWPCPIFPAARGGDVFGYGRFGELARKGRPDVVLIHSDPWIVANYLRLAKKIDESAEGWGKDYSRPPIVAWMPIDSPGTSRATAELLNDLTLAVFYSEFALADARRAGFTGPGMSIGLGVDLGIYQAEDQETSRRSVFERDDGKTTMPLGCFLVGNVNRNQARKRFDLSIAYFAKWVKEYGRRDAWLYFHAAVAEDVGWNLHHLADYYGVSDRVILSDLDFPRAGAPENELRYVYSSFDVQISTTTGEGFGLTTAEGMACGVPQIVPDYSALGEWAKDAVHMVPVTATAAHIGKQSNCIGGIVDEQGFIEALDELYLSETLRARIGRAGLVRVSEKQFRWETIGERFAAALQGVTTEEHTAAA